MALDKPQENEEGKWGQAAFEASEGKGINLYMDSSVFWKQSLFPRYLSVELRH